jgi:hypothetical protein
MRKISLIAFATLSPFLLAGCLRQATQSNDSKIAEQQEQQQAEGDAQVPPPAIKNWNEKRLLKAVMERRDQTDLATWTYTKNLDGKYTWICESIGYGIPYNTRANNPQHYEFMSTRTGAAYNGSGYYTDGQGHPIWGEHAVVAQSEPNGLFIPESAKGTWNTCRNPNTGKPAITYQEEDVSVFPYRLPDGMVEGFHPAPLPPVSQEDVARVAPPLLAPAPTPRTATASAP